MLEYLEKIFENPFFTLNKIVDLLQMLFLVHSFQMGMFLLSSITESANEQLRPHFPSLFQLFSSTLEDQESKLVPFYTIR